MIYLRYLWYILRHKWFVFVAGMRLIYRLHHSQVDGFIPWRTYAHVVWLLVIHDWSKFLPDELIPYARHFKGTPRNLADRCNWREAFDYAWNRHQKRNPHHWQYWLVSPDKPLCMPRAYIIEMVADWMGAGRANGSPDTLSWYRAQQQQHRLVLEVMTEEYAAFLVGDRCDALWAPRDGANRSNRS